MNWSKIFITRPVMTSLVMAGIVFFGIAAFHELAVSDLPNIDFPTIQVTASNPGSDAETMAVTVATPLEQQFMTIMGVQNIQSTSSSGYTQIVVTFDLSRDIDGASTDISAAINRASSNLPKTMPDPPQYEKYNPSASPIMFIALSSETMTPAKLYDFANTVIAQQLSVLNGVSNVAVYGTKSAVRIQIDPAALAYRGIGLDQLADRISSSTQQLPGGNLYNAYQNYIINPLGQLEKADEYKKIILASNEENVVTLQDVAKPIDSAEQEYLYINYWQADVGEKPTIILGIIKQAGFNTVQVCQSITDALPNLSKTLPESISLHTLFDASKEIEAGIEELEMTVIIAYVLVIFVVYFFLGRFRITIITSAILPIALIGTSLFMYLCNFSIDILSLLGITLVVGFLIDDALVVVENIFRHLEMGKKPLQAALDGSRQIGSTVLSMTLSLCALSMPLAFMPGIIGRMFREFALVVILSVLFSCFLALSFTPMLCARFLKKEKSLSFFEKLSHKMFHYLLKIYLPQLKWVLQRPLVPIGFVATALALTAYLFTIVPKDFLPPGDTGVIQGVAFAPQNISPESMALHQAEVSKIFRENPHVYNVISIANTPGSMPNQGFLWAVLKPSHLRPPIDDVLAQLSAACSSIMDLNVFLKPYPEINLDIGTSFARASFNVQLSTIESAGILYAATESLTEALKKMPGLKSVSNDILDSCVQYNFHIHRDIASTYGISTQAIETALMLGFAQGQITTFNTPINEYKVILQMQAPYRQDPSVMSQIYLAKNTPNASKQELVPLQELVSWEKTTAPLSINHANQFTAATIYFNIEPGVSLGDVISGISDAANSLLPATVSYNFQGTAEVFRQTFASLSALSLIGIICIYLILGVLYESFLHPITILSALPGAIFGALLTLFVFQYSLSIYSYIGMIVLIGLVMKNGIMLVEFANELVQQKKSALEAIVEASRIRFRPILMTTIAAGAGIFPAALGLIGKESSKPLGLVIVGGLVFSQLITFFFTPVVYLLLEKFQEALSKTRGGAAKLRSRRGRTHT